MIVGFSQGGVIGTHFANTYLKKKITIFTLCSPFGGSLMAYLLPFTGIKELRGGSTFLAKVNAPSIHEIHSIWTPFDLMVFPGWNAIGPGRNYQIWCPIHTFIVCLWPKTKKIFTQLLEQKKNRKKQFKK
jgi:pimeloyl-ACP methyl ester carboxylesterase